ncbi:hypothetical protein E2562_033264 [Oryza meyeriana var. granulata]|uniref:SANT domain-containing protein n=1 Tax=Oryza meyeriana var. granulata TaxID=110450 RepID=A0A6G1CWJ3_9ORYZ|nr:hypothetical protein E2562_033264 [Oryza meyeriana var. granulata]
MSSSWTVYQNRLFEQALAIYDEDTPDRWQKVARAVGGGKSADDVKRHFDWLERDVNHIDSEDGQGSKDGGGGGGSSSNPRGDGRSEEQRLSDGKFRSMVILIAGADSLCPFLILITIWLAKHGDYERQTAS